MASQITNNQNCPCLGDGDHSVGHVVALLHAGVAAVVGVVDARGADVVVDVVVEGGVLAVRARELRRAAEGLALAQHVGRCKKKNYFSRPYLLQFQSFSCRCAIILNIICLIVKVYKVFTER